MSVKNLWTIAVVSLFILGLTSCASTPKPLYSWHKYEDAAYQHSKKQTEKSEKTFVKQINQVLEKQTGSRHTVPPGIFAEYGYYLIKKGQTQQGCDFLKKEIASYPESEIFISRIINQIESVNE